MSLPAYLSLPGGSELIVILALILLLFGASAVPKLARSMGRAQGEFQRARKEMSAEMEAGAKEAASTPARNPEVAKTAQQLGIETDGKSDDELRALIAERLQ